MSLVDDLVAAVKASNPSEDAVHHAIENCLAVPHDDAGKLEMLGSIVAAQFKYIDTHVRVPQHQVRQGRRPDAGGPTKVAAIKSYAFKFYKQEVAS